MVRTLRKNNLHRRRTPPRGSPGASSRRAPTATAGRSLEEMRSARLPRARERIHAKSVRAPRSRRCVWTRTSAHCQRGATSSRRGCAAASKTRLPRERTHVSTRRRGLGAPFDVRRLRRSTCVTVGRRSRSPSIYVKARRPRACRSSRPLRTRTHAFSWTTSRSWCARLPRRVHPR